MRWDDVGNNLVHAHLLINEATCCKTAIEIIGLSRTLADLTNSISDADASMANCKFRGFVVEFHIDVDGMDHAGERQGQRLSRRIDWLADGGDLGLGVPSAWRVSQRRALRGEPDLGSSRLDGLLCDRCRGVDRVSARKDASVSERAGPISARHA